VSHERNMHPHHGPVSSVTSYSATDGSKTLIWGFAIIILAGAILLKLPVASAMERPLTWQEALFTSTSATTVTGLVVLNTANDLSVFGQVVVLLLIQVGGVGFMVLSVVLFRLIGRRVGLGERLLLRQVLGVKQSQGLVHLTLVAAIVVVGIELIGAIILFFTWLDIMPPRQAAYFAIFHSISAFCNAGFDLFQGTTDPILVATRQDPLAVFALSTLIIIGTLGIVVIFDVLTYFKVRQLSLHSRLIIPLTIILTVLGTALLLADEAIFGHALSDMSPLERWLTALFTVVSSRTAGITFVPIQDLGQASQLTLMIFMFIGSAPASMGGGVGLTTVAVVLITLYTNVRGYPDVRIFERTIPTETLHKAVAIITVSTVLVAGVTMFELLAGKKDLFATGFEVVSAFSNTGYSLGITSQLNVVSRILIVLTMFWGRLGPLTLVVALAQRRHKTQIRYPQEHIIIG